MLCSDVTDIKNINRIENLLFSLKSVKRVLKRQKSFSYVTRVQNQTVCKEKKLKLDLETYFFKLVII